ncbi:MAG TPA: proteasome subunit alpha [Streptosporangiaceae bacterium]
MPFYVSPEQQMKDKADFARKAITRGRSGVVIDYDAGFLFVSPNPSRALHKFSELYDRIAFAAAGRYNEFDRLRQAGVRYADLTGYQYDRQDVTSRGLANWYAQVLGTIFIESNKPLEVEMAIAEVGDTAADDQIYRITFDGTITEEHHYLVMGGQADPVAAVLKERYAEGATLAGAMAVAIAALAAGQGNGGEQTEITAASLEVATLDRSRTSHRMFRRLTGPRLEELLAQARASAPASAAPAPADAGDAGTSPAASGGTGSGGTGSGTGGAGNGTPEPGSADSGSSPGQ